MPEITKKEITFASADGKSTVHGYFWIPEGEPRGIVQLSHGMCEYVERYDAWARRFAAAGLVFCGNDHIGHGRTAPTPDELGFTAEKDGAHALVEDLHTMSYFAKKEFPALPLFLYGHSMGSFAARIYLTRYGDELAGALISGTGGPGNPTGLGRRIARISGAASGQTKRSKFIKKMAFGAYNKHFKEEKDPNAWLTRDPEVRRLYAADPYCNYDFTTAGYDTLFSMLGEVSKSDWAEHVPQKLPVLLFSGDEDPVGNYGKGVRAVYDRLVAAGVHATLKLYPKGRHEMHNETNRDEVFADLISFIEGVL